jgi:bifunctional non-homologous end joining protein LigD
MPPRTSSRPKPASAPRAPRPIVRPDHQAPAPGRPPALSAYAAKRDLARSAEPPAVLPSRRAPTTRAFCIQKHLAHHLHYDFRLEHRGVLLSWAIPKGPSTDPAVKRLAMQVEDHPVAYGKFEGVIDSGYGAGIVMLWDEGVWAPVSDDVDAALAAGHLSFVLRATKLEGGWSLIRTRRPGRPSWLLIKARDGYASTRDVTTARPHSVNGAADFPDILARQGREPWPDGPPVGGGETGELFRSIMKRARRLQARPARRS